MRKLVLFTIISVVALCFAASAYAGTLKPGQKTTCNNAKKSLWKHPEILPKGIAVTPMPWSGYLPAPSRMQSLWGRRSIRILKVAQRVPLLQVFAVCTAWAAKKLYWVVKITSAVAIPSGTSVAKFASPTRVRST